MKLAIITAIHGREGITAAFLSAMSRIRQDLNVQTYIVVSDDDPNIPLIGEYDFPYVEHPNKPLGRKWNAGVRSMQCADFTHVMILGSDDIPSTRFVKNAMELGEYDISGCDGLWFWGMNPRRAGFGRFGYFPVPKVLAGPGKVLSRRALECCDWAPWPENCNYGMDAKMMNYVRTGMKSKGVLYKSLRYSIRDTQGFLVDVKYQHHISSLSPVLRRDNYIEQDPMDVVPYHLPKGECDYLFRLHETTKDNWNKLKNGQ
jgi:hypothetical protein